MSRRLSVSILPDGNIIAEASGTPGPDCLNAINQLRRMLDAEVFNSKPTPEFTETSVVVKVNADVNTTLEDLA